MNFSDQLISAVQEKKSHVCVGLDPRLNRIPTEIVNKKEGAKNKAEAATKAVTEFNQGLIDAIKDQAVVVKLQLAFYEIFGPPGLEAVLETARYAKKQGLLVIIDGKRNDIGSTALAYAQAYLDEKKSLNELSNYVDALTINPYLGSDGIQPFIDICCEQDKGIFVLVKTSNPSSAELQDLKLETGGLVYQHLAEMTAKWGTELKGKHGYSSLGAVVGATYPQELKELRQKMPTNYFLVPGFGAQGGGADDIIAAFNKDGLGAVINSSRGINFAYQKDEYSDDYQKAAYQAATQMNQEINQALAKADKLAW